MRTRCGPRLPASRIPLVAFVGLCAGLCALSCPAAAGVAMADPVPDTEASARSEVSIDIPRPSAESGLSIGLRVAVCLDVGPLAGLGATVEIGACRQEAPSAPPSPTPSPPQPSPRPEPATPTPPAPRPPAPRPSTSQPSTPKPAVPRPAPSRSVTVPAALPRVETVRPPKRSRPAKTPRPSASPTRPLFRAATLRLKPRPERRRPLSTLVIIVVLTTVIAGGVAAAFNAAR